MALPYFVIPPTNLLFFGAFKTCGYNTGTFPSDRWRAGERARRVKLAEPGLLCNSGRH